MAWTALTFAYGSLLTSTKMTQLFDNFQAFADKDSGAPVLANDYIIAAMIATGEVGADAIAANAVRASEINFANSARSSQLISASSTFTPAASLAGYAEPSGDVIHEVRDIGGTWRTSGHADLGGSGYADGTNMRFNNTSGASNRELYWSRLA